ncbi:hypothetical protein Btru_066902 [Bulinus truncatus]|nr:hypothetical protein Btru_066902 [Bulinus truncatus]
MKPLGVMPLGIPQNWESRENVISLTANMKSRLSSLPAPRSFELLANMPPLGVFSNSNDMDTLDGLSNLDMGPLVRRQLDSETRNGLSRAFIGLDESWQNDDRPFNKKPDASRIWGSKKRN